MKLKSGNNHSSQVLFLSSYPPRPCGIATYSKDLIDAIHNKFSSSFSLKVCALENTENIKNYPGEVKYVLKTDAFQNYVRLADQINRDDEIKKVFIQHEFGLFGGNYGELILYLVYFLNKPISVTFHTVLPRPDEKRKKIVQAIANMSEEVVVMTKKSADILHLDYGISIDKIVIIPHGAHNVQWKNKMQFKKLHRLEEYLVMSTFGLLSENKCIETSLNALPKIIKKFPNLIFLIIGRTHPAVVASEGEKYRQFLESRVDELQLHNNVRFIDKYLDLPELLEFLSLSDIYLFTSKDPHQAVSGTFAYAMSCACPVISTPIPFAQEMLNRNAGILVDFHNSNELSKAAIRLLKDKDLREEMGLNAFLHTRTSIWENSAIAHAALFNRHVGQEALLHFDLPEIKLKHIYSLTDDKGIIQFAKISDPDLESGYTLDDNARALIALCLHFDVTKKSPDLNLIEIYLNFINYCQQRGGHFLNYVDKDGGFHSQNDYNNLQDSNGRAIWALGLITTYRDSLPAYLIDKAEVILKKSLPIIEHLDSPRAIAFTIKGLYFYQKEIPDNKKFEQIEMLANKLKEKYFKISDANWRWYEGYLTYANSVMPEAMLYAFLATGKKSYKDIAEISFEFLLSHIFTKDAIKVVSNRGWHHKSETPEQFGEQPIDVAYTILALELFYEVFGKDEYTKKMDLAFSWFLGKNHLDQIIYNPLTGGCYDGLEKYNVNLNQGAESAVCYLIARLIIERNKKDPEKKVTVLGERKKVFSMIQKNPHFNSSLLDNIIDGKKISVEDLASIEMVKK